MTGPYGSLSWDSFSNNSKAPDMVSNGVCCIAQMNH